METTQGMGMGMKELIALLLMTCAAAAQVPPATPPTGLPDPAKVQEACQKLQADLATVLQDANAVQSAGGVVMASPPSQNPSESPDRTFIVPAKGAIIDSNGDVWSINAGLLILKNGAMAYNNWQSHELYYLNHTIYQFGLDSKWWGWNGTQFIGPPAGGTQATGPQP